MTLHKHNATKTGSAWPAEYTIKCERGRYRIYDKQSRFRCEFATPEAANAYVAQRSGAPCPSQLATRPEAQPS